MKAATQLAALSVLLKALKSREAALRETVADEMLADDAKTLTPRLGDDKLGTLSLVEFNPTIDVTDPAALLAWFESNAPQEVETYTPPTPQPIRRVKPETLKSFLATLDANPHGVVDPETGEAIPGLSYVAPKKPHTSFRAAKGAADTVVRFMSAGRLPELMEVNDER